MKEARASKSKPESEFVGVCGKRVFSDVGLVGFEIRKNLFGLWLAKWYLAKDGKSSANAAFLGDI